MGYCFGDRGHRDLPSPGLNLPSLPGLPAGTVHRGLYFTLVWLALASGLSALNPTSPQNNMKLSSHSALVPGEVLGLHYSA